MGGQVPYWAVEPYDDDEYMRVWAGFIWHRIGTNSRLLFFGFI
jgi:hypothetical protein